MTTAEDYIAEIALKRGLLAAGQSLAEVDDSKLARAVADEFGLRWVELRGLGILPEVLAAVPPDFVRSRHVIPFAREGGRLHVAVVDPLAVDVTDDLAYATGEVVQAALASAADVRAAIGKYYGADADLVETTSQTLPAEQNGDRDAPIIKLVHGMLAEAARRRASDIHVEPLANRLRVRYRIDGALWEADALPARMQPAIISRLKIMANINIAEKRLPQDGRIQINLDGRALDLRVSSLPTAHGESMVMRILDKEALKPGLVDLGFLPDDQMAFDRSIATPDGLMLVTGPTGSGKTTTLYAALHQLNQPDRKIITVEEPVEYQFTGINQVPVNTVTGMTFAAALRAMLRQAPNVIMVGEIRDRETAEIAINASLTGHTVFSTLHTNDAPGAVTRLVDIGAKPFLVAASLRSVLAQRLVRRICPACKRGYTPAPRELHAVGFTAAQRAGAEFARGTGCVACQGTGYRGRMGIFEMLTVNDAIRSMIYDKVTAARLRARARQDGMRTLREDGVRKVLAGLTTIEEVVSATVGDPL